MVFWQTVWVVAKDGCAKDEKLLEDKKDKAKMLLQIHDELIFECLKKDENKIKQIIKEGMISISK